jgi:outer membrane protein W
MKRLETCVVVVGFIVLAFVGLAEAQKIGNSISVSAGYWKPSLEEANDGLKLWAAEVADAEIRARGDDEFTGNFTAGGALTIGLSERAVLRAEIFYWKKSVEQTAHEEQVDPDFRVVFDGEASASVRIIPVLLSGQFYLGNLQSQVRPYAGGGLGLALTAAEVKASARVQFTSDQFGNASDQDSFDADDSGSSVILQFFGGVEFVSSKSLAFFAEAKYLSGKFNVKEQRNDIDEDVSLSGLQLNGGIRFYFGN